MPCRPSFIARQGAPAHLLRPTAVPVLPRPAGATRLSDTNRQERPRYSGRVRAPNGLCVTVGRHVESGTLRRTKKKKRKKKKRKVNRQPSRVPPPVPIPVVAAGRCCAFICAFCPPIFSILSFFFVLFVLFFFFSPSRDDEDACERNATTDCRGSNRQRVY